MKAPPKPVTILDVARAANVGVGTVSRVLNGGHKVSPLTQEWVLSVIRQLGFRPNAAARRILRPRAGMVCFILSNRDFLHSFHARILQGVEKYASSLKQHVVFAVAHYGQEVPSAEIPLPPILQERGLVDGLILAGTTYPNFLERIRSIHLPFVMFGNNFVGPNGHGRFDQVCFDGAHAEYESTAYLIAQGHRNIVFVGDVTYPWIAEREKGFRRAMEAARLKPVVFTTHRQASYREYGEWAAPHLLSSDPQPTAVVAANDAVAYGVWRHLLIAGVRVPEQISLIGFDDLEEAQLINPPLTTVRVPNEVIGRALMELLVKRLRGPRVRFAKKVIPTELVLRGSVRRVH